MPDGSYQRTAAPRLMPAPLGSLGDLDGLLARLVRYQDGPNLVTLSADAVPAELTDAFPLTMKEWERALQRRATENYWTSDGGAYVELTAIVGGWVFRGRGELVNHYSENVFYAYIDGAPDREPRWEWLSASEILRVTDLGDPPYPRPQDGCTLVPTLADACCYGSDIEVADGRLAAVWHHSEGILRLSQGFLQLDGPVFSVVGAPFADEVVPRGLIRAVDGAPVRGWFWMAIVADLQAEIGASLAILLADTEELSGEPTVLVRGVLAGIDLEPEVPVLLIEVPEPDGFAVCRVGLQAVGRMEIYPLISESGDLRQGFVELGQLPPPHVARGEALEQIRDGGDYLLLWQPHSEAFGMLQLRDVQLVGDQIHGTRGDGVRLELPVAEILAVQDQEATVQRRLAEKLAWWDVLPDLLAPLEGRRGAVVLAIDGRSVVHEGVTYRGEGGEGFRFATAAGVEEAASDDLLAFEVDCPDCGGYHL